jgi:propanol-preferring alcohol dehydrogenase
VAFVQNPLGRAALPAATDDFGRKAFNNWALHLFFRKATVLLSLNLKQIWLTCNAMHAMLFSAVGKPLQMAEVAQPEPGSTQVVVRVRACGVCRTDLHVIDGELPNPKLPLIPGHQIVGEIVAKGAHVDRLQLGDRVGIPWLGYTCGVCAYCRTGRENLCDQAQFTGYQIDGGYAEFARADHRFCFPLPDIASDVHMAPLMCGGFVGYRALGMAGDARNLGIYGFGAAAHIIVQVALYQGRRVFAFTRDGDVEGQQFAREMGAVWAGGSSTLPPEPLDAAILFAPVGALVPVALRALAKGGTLVCGGIHMSEIPAFSYDLLWNERVVRSVANLTRRDGDEFLALAAKIPVRTEVEVFPLAQANEALHRLRSSAIRGAAVLEPA